METKTLLFAADSKKLAEQGEVIDDLDVKLIEEMHALDNILKRLGEMGLTAYFAIRRDFPDDTLRLSQALTVTTNEDDPTDDRDKLVWIASMRYVSENHDNRLINLAVLNGINRDQAHNTCADCAKRDTCEKKC